MSPPPRPRAIAAAPLSSCWSWTSKFHFLKKGAKVLDLGAAPGGWSQVAAARGATVVAADVLAMEAIPGVTFFQADLTDAARAGDAESRRWAVPPIWC